MAPIKTSQVQEALHLFRSILRLHRTKLPEEMRQLGDAHVRSEFQAHLRSKNTTPEQLSEFVFQWKGYLGMLQPLAARTGSTADAAAAGEQPSAEHATEHATAVHHVSVLTEGLDEYASPEQKLRMEALRKEASQLGQAMLGKAMPSQQVADQLGNSERAPGAHQ